MVFKKKGMWKHSLSAQKFSSKEEALAAYNLMYAEEVVLDAPEEPEVCPVCNGEECQCDEEDLSPLEKLWKSADPT